MKKGFSSKKIFVKKKTHNKGKFMETSLKLIGTILQHY